MRPGDYFKACKQWKLMIVRLVNNEAWWLLGLLTMKPDDSYAYKRWEMVICRFETMMPDEG